MADYKIIRFYSPSDGRPNRTIKIVHSLEEAQRHTSNPKTRKEGVYFDGYTEIKAEHGYHGYVTKPTHILAGEHGRERVDITPLKKNKSKNFNDYWFS